MKRDHMSSVLPSGPVFAKGRPVLTRSQILQLSNQLLEMSSADTVQLQVTHTARVITRVVNNRILAGDDGDELRLQILTKFGSRESVRILTNQMDRSSLQALVRQCEEIARRQIGTDEELRHVPRLQDEYLRVSLWHESTVDAMTTTRRRVVLEIVSLVTKLDLHCASFLGFMARSQAVLTKEGIFAFSEETDSEVTVTGRSKDGTSSGWMGQAARDWSMVDYRAVATRAADIAVRGKGAQALEPGRRTVILSPAAVAQVARHFATEFDAHSTDVSGMTAFSKSSRGGTKLHARVFDSRISMYSDPADPMGGYANYFGMGFRNPKMTWVEGGVLKNLAYDPNYAMQKGKAYAEIPISIHITGGPTPVDEMIARCQDGVYVNRFSHVDLISLRTGMMTGVTRDGCFLVRNGKLERPVKNFRFTDSPFFFMNRLEALGRAERAAFGYTPPGPREGNTSWPRRPIIAPPMMVRDFNFSALADAV
jgi:predicted Zn-dependent protease